MSVTPAAPRSPSRGTRASGGVARASVSAGSTATITDSLHPDRSDGRALSVGVGHAAIVARVRGPAQRASKRVVSVYPPIAEEPEPAVHVLREDPIMTAGQADQQQEEEKVIIQQMLDDHPSPPPNRQSSFPIQLCPPSNTHQWHPTGRHEEVLCNGPHCRVLAEAERKLSRYSCKKGEGLLRECKAPLNVCCDCSHTIDAICGLGGTGAGWGCPCIVLPLENWAARANAPLGSNPPARTPLARISALLSQPGHSSTISATNHDPDPTPTSSTFRNLVNLILGLRRRFHNALIPRHDWLRADDVDGTWRALCIGPRCRERAVDERLPYQWQCTLCPGLLRVCSDCKVIIDGACRAGDGEEWVCGTFGVTE